MSSNADLLKFELKRVFFAFDPTLGNESIRHTLLGLPIHLPANRTELFQEDLLRMLRSLSLHVAHDFASLSQVQLRPVAYIHLKNVSLRKFDFGLSQEVQIMVLKQRGSRSTSTLD